MSCCKDFQATSSPVIFLEDLRACHFLLSVLSLSCFSVSLEPMWNEWWTWSMFASVSHQLQPHCVLHLSTPHEAFSQQTILLWWARTPSSFVMPSPYVIKIDTMSATGEAFSFTYDYLPFSLTTTFTADSYYHTFTWIWQKRSANVPHFTWLIA